MLDTISNQFIKMARYTQEDIEPIFYAITDSYHEIAPWVTWLTNDYSLNQSKSFVKMQIHNWQEDIEYAFTIKDYKEKLLGVINLHVYDEANGVANIGYWMNTKYTGKGYCTQAVKLLVENAMKQLNLIRIELIVSVKNLASQKVAIKSGAQFEGELKNRIRLDGIASNANIYAFI